MFSKISAFSTLHECHRKPIFYSVWDIWGRKKKGIKAWQLPGLLNHGKQEHQSIAEGEKQKRYNLKASAQLFLLSHHMSQIERVRNRKEIGSHGASKPHFLKKKNK